MEHVSRRHAAFLRFFLLVGTLGLSWPLEAQESDVNKVARELSNPVGSLASLNFQGNYQRLDGSAPGVSDHSSTSLVFLPTIPFKVASGNLIVRPAFPFIGTPVPDGSGEWTKERGFGDMQLVVNWGRVEKSGLLWSLGGTFVFPTGSNEFVTQDQWQAGPAAILGLIKEWGVLGGFWQHWYGLNSPEGRAKADLGSLQVFYWFGLGNGWQVGGSPVLSQNYVARETNQFTFPLNLGVAKTFVLGKMPFKATVQAQYFLTRPDVTGPSWGIFFQFSPVVRVPW